MHVLATAPVRRLFDNARALTLPLCRSAPVRKHARKMAASAQFGGQPALKLQNGCSIPLVGLGTWKSKAGDVEKAVKAAIESGYRHIDCAYAYGNEGEVGAALKEKIGGGEIKREEIFITSKLWNTDHAAARVEPAVRRSLTSLGLDYLDLYLIHWPHALKEGDDNFPKYADGSLIPSEVHYLETWKAMENLVDLGLVKSIGLSNFNSHQIQEVLDNCRIRPVVNQVEVHPYFSQDRLAQFCKDRDVVITAYSPLGSPDRPWASPDEPTILEDPDIKTIAARCKKSSAQVILRWLLQRNIVVIPKSVTPSRIKENLQVNDFVLSDDDMKVINNFNRSTRLIVPTIVIDGKRVFRDAHHTHFPFNIPF